MEPDRGPTDVQSFVSTPGKQQADVAQTARGWSRMIHTALYSRMSSCGTHAGLKSSSAVFQPVPPAQC